MQLVPDLEDVVIEIEAGCAVVVAMEPADVVATTYYYSCFLSIHVFSHIHLAISCSAVDMPRCSVLLRRKQRRCCGRVYAG